MKKHRFAIGIAVQVAGAALLFAAPWWQPLGVFSAFVGLFSLCVGYVMAPWGPSGGGNDGSGFAR